MADKSGNLPRAAYAADPQSSEQVMMAEHAAIVRLIWEWLERIDPGTHRRIKGLRLVTAYGIGALLGMQQQVTRGLPDAAALSSLAGGFALWASVSECRTTRIESSRDLILLATAATAGATLMIVLAPGLGGSKGGWPGAELTLVSGAFLVGAMRRFGVLGAGIGSQVFIGELLAYGLGLTPADLGTVAVAGLLAAVAAVVPRILSGPAEHPALSPVAPILGSAASMRMGVQGAIAASVIVLLNDAVGLRESSWAIAACTYVIAGTRGGTIERVRRRIVGTAIGVPLGLVCLPIALHAPLVIWLMAALAMIIYSMALPERYDIACGTYAFALIVTLAATGESSVSLLVARAWETLIGGMLGLTAAFLVMPIRAER